MLSISRWLLGIKSRRMVRKLTSAYSEVYIYLFHKDRLISINMKDVIDFNFNGAVKVFNGFFGSGYNHLEDPNLYTVVKNVSQVNPQEAALARALVNRLGFELIVSTSEEQTKVMLVPGSLLAPYLATKGTRVRYQKAESLYLQMRSNF